MFRPALIVFLGTLGILLLLNGLNIAVDNRLADIVRVFSGVSAILAAFFCRWGI